MTRGLIWTGSHCKGPSTGREVDSHQYQTLGILHICGFGARLGGLETPVMGKRKSPNRA
jgi:hypothetical protein